MKAEMVWMRLSARAPIPLLSAKAPIPLLSAGAPILPSTAGASILLLISSRDRGFFRIAVRWPG